MVARLRWAGAHNKKKYIELFISVYTLVILGVNELSIRLYSPKTVAIIQS